MPRAQNPRGRLGDAHYSRSEEETPNDGRVAARFALGSQIVFSDTSTAGNGTFTNNGGTVSGAGGGQITFLGKSKAGNATLIANGAPVSGAFGGRIEFTGFPVSHGGRVEVFGNGTGDSTNGSLDVSGSSRTKIGSIEGTGVLSPGRNSISPGTLTINSALTFNSQSTYKVDFDSSSPAADKVICNGVTIASGAQFSFADHGTGALTPGTIFTVIDNTAGTPIAGNFRNLPDNSTFTNNGNTYKASYTGGNGNDLTLTVQ